MKTFAFTAAAIALIAVVFAPGSGRAADPGHGQELFGYCTPCHEVGVGARNRTGPVLNSIVGRRIGARRDYKYSNSLEEAGTEGMVWSAAVLDGYLENPRVFLRGTRMAFAGMSDSTDRADLIAYLATLKFDTPTEQRTFR
jgi:cytochrome c